MQKNNYSLSIDNPEYFFVNCNGSYIVSAVNFFAKNKCSDDLLLFLANCKLKFLNLDLKETKEISNNNAWRFQLLKLCNSEGIPLFSGNTFLSLMEYVHKNFNINSHYIRNENPILTIEEIIESIVEGSPVIVKIDEYFNPASQYFYKQNHNTHSVLVKGVNYKEKYFEIIDTESKQLYNMEFKYLIDSFKYSIYRKDCIQLNCSNFENKINIEEFAKKYFAEDRIYSELNLFADRLPEYFKEDDPEFLLKGLLFSINYQIVPMLRGRSHLIMKFIDSDKHFDELRNKVNNPYKLWMNLKFLILKKLKLKEGHHTNINEKIQNILDAERRILSEIKSII
ncbi:BtrH N-terminal domain-containing protein [Bacillus mycoides]|uniref:Butirosin biosynthesis protein H N-terminal domain-containing protein n=1 Tax=Bacillus mycoides TaxID=1405 RepID=A0A1S9T0Y4_BACMY|nr:BtrH N-terminal domain-containing protein [Bacillus mycoides]OOR03673.1 hypothetical protein BW900_25915 [Bacillus mycoides]